MQNLYSRPNMHMHISYKCDSIVFRFRTDVLHSWLQYYAMTSSIRPALCLAIAQLAAILHE